MTAGKRSTGPCAAPGCGRDARTKGFCSTHYEHNRKCGDPLSRRERIDRFLADLVSSPTDQCVSWPFAVSSAGYGVVIHDGKMMTALRAALVMLTGENPSGMDAAHGACHNRLCCNPHPEHGASWKTRARLSGWAARPTETPSRSWARCAWRRPPSPTSPGSATTGDTTAAAAAATAATTAAAAAAAAARRRVRVRVARAVVDRPPPGRRQARRQRRQRRWPPPHPPRAGEPRVAHEEKERMNRACGLARGAQPAGERSGEPPTDKVRGCRPTLLKNAKTCPLESTIPSSS